MNNLQQFTNGSISLPVRVTNDGNIEFDAEQVALGLGLSTVAKSGNDVVRWNRVSKYLSRKVGKGDFITEAQFYKLAIKANNSVAEKFQDWVTQEVLPTIRKHGAYMTPETIEKTLTDPDFIIGLATRLKTEHESRLLAEQQVNELQPKATYYDLVLQSKSTMSVSKISKDFGMSPQKMNSLLHEWDVQYKQGIWLLYAKYQDKGYTQTSTYPVGDGTETKPLTKWTQKGRLFIYEIFKQHGFLPLIEQTEMSIS